MHPADLPENEKLEHDENEQIGYGKAHAKSDHQCTAINAFEEGKKEGSNERDTHRQQKG